MGGREHYAWAAKAVALGDRKASEHEGPLSQSVRGARKKERGVAGKHGANNLRQMIVKGAGPLGKNMGAGGGAMRTVKYEVSCTNGAFNVETADVKVHLMR